VFVLAGAIRHSYDIGVQYFFSMHHNGEVFELVKRFVDQKCSLTVDQLANVVYRVLIERFECLTSSVR